MENTNNEAMKIFGEAILLASMQFSIGSVEMSSKFSVKNFSKDQETLQNAADALVDYIRIAILWTIGLGMLFYSKYGTQGVVVVSLCNLFIIFWIYYSYIASFISAANKYNLDFPIINIL